MKTLETIYKNTFLTKLVIVFLLVTNTIGCSKDDGPAPQEIVKSSEKQITSFVFQASDNPIDIQIEANINEQNKTITATLPSDTPLTDLTPVLSISEKASINLTGVEDFTTPVTYTVTAEDGTTTSYTVTVTSNSSAKEITSFVFLLTNNPIEVNIVATIDEENKTISATMPPNTDITGLLPDVQISDLATIDLTAAQNFTEPIEYTVTAQDGSTSIYTVTLTTLLTQRQILQAILDVNPLLNWDLQNTEDLGDLAGVTTNVLGEIISISYSFSNEFSVIPPEIGQLKKLKRLYFVAVGIKSIPPEIGQLKELEELDLSISGISELPPELFSLTALTKLTLNNNSSLTSIPAGLGQLINLTDLDLSYTGLTSLPPEIGQLTNLTSLRLGGSKFTSLSSEIGQLANLLRLDLEGTSLTSLPPAIGQLTKLTDLNLERSKLTQLPAKIGQLTKLKELNLIDNQLTTLPLEIGQLISLERLELNNNQLTELSSAIQKLANLKSLYLSDNQLTSISGKINVLTKLTLLDISNNPLTNIPQQICDMRTENDGILTLYYSNSSGGCN